MRRLDRSWFERDAPAVAPDLLGKLLTVFVAATSGTGGVEDVITAGRITETEAYMPDDPASHTYNGETSRNAVMFGPAGHLYVYLSYGIHHCANVVTGPIGSGQAVLLRAIQPIEGIDTMRARRSHRPVSELANGPGKLCAALGIGAAHNGLDLLDAGGHRPAVAIVDDGTAPPSDPLVGPRIGISKAVEVPWRFRLPTDVGADR